MEGGTPGKQGRGAAQKRGHLTLSTPVLPVGMAYLGASFGVDEVQEDKEERIVERKG